MQRPVIKSALSSREIRLDRILVGVDFSNASIEALRWAALSFAPQAEQILLHCVDVPKPPAFLRGRFGSHDELVRTAHAGAVQRLDELSQSLAGSRVRTEVRERPPAEGIVEVAAELEADLVVVGEHGRRPGVWDLQADTAERVLRQSTVPVLVVQRAPSRAPRNILVAVDDSEVTDELLLWGFNLANRFVAGLVAFHALDFFGFDYQAWIASPETLVQEEQARQGGTRWLKQRLVRLALPPDRATMELAVGDARYEIPSAATRLGAELVIIGSGGPGARQGHFLGTVSSAVMRTAHCPVLVVPPPDRQST